MAYLPEETTVSKKKKKKKKKEQGQEATRKISHHDQHTSIRV
jgi:hypothetical protein